MLSPNTNALIQNLRAKAQANTLTQEEAKQGILLLREGRFGAVKVAKTKATAKAKAAEKTADDLFNELEGLE